jgi:hypothetical protein
MGFHVARRAIPLCALSKYHFRLRTISSLIVAGLVPATQIVLRCADPGRELLPGN